MNQVWNTTILCLLLCLRLTIQCSAQTESLHFEHIGVEEGLLNENITAMLQDSKGFLWFGTFDGLYRYDAYSFTRYQFDPSDSNSLPDNFIYTIFEDRNGTIWVSTSEGLCKFDRATEKFTGYKPLPDAKFFNPNISAINEDATGMLWVGSTSGELCRFEQENRKVSGGEFRRRINGAPRRATPYYMDYYKDRAGQLWAGSRNGLHELKITPATSSKAVGITIKNYLTGNNVGSIMEDRTGVLWVGTDNGLLSLDKKNGGWKQYQHDPGNIHSINSNNLAIWFGNNIKEDGDGNLWIGTDKGLNKLNADRTLFTPYFNNPDDPYSLSANTITGLQIDKAGILWAAVKNGVRRKPPGERN